MPTTSSSQPADSAAPAAARRKTVVLIDDCELIRQGLRRAFERTEDFEVLGEAANMADGVELVTQSRPDVVIVDLKLPDGHGLDATQRIRADMPDIGIVVLTMYAGDEHLFGALDAGASAFVPKTAVAREVVAAARTAAESPKAFTAADLAPAMRRRLNPTGPKLTTREQEILDLLAAGLQIAQIGRQMYISTSTAKAAITTLYEKLGAANRAQALMTAVNLGLVNWSSTAAGL